MKQLIIISSIEKDRPSRPFDSGNPMIKLSDISYYRCIGIDSGVSLPYRR
jgi:hypothetical protein